MRILFELDKKDYTQGGTIRNRPSARAVIIKDGKVGMIYSKKYNYYKFPGGGIEPNEDKMDALKREVLEETGFSILAGSIQEYGSVRRIEKDKGTGIFVQDNYYFLCDIATQGGGQDLDDYEADEGFTFLFIKPQTAIDTNRKTAMGLDEFRQSMLEREARVLEILLSEGYFPIK